MTDFSDEFTRHPELEVVKSDRGVEETINDIFDYWIKDETRRGAFRGHMYQLLSKEIAHVKTIPEESEKLVKFIANDYIELSHDKVAWQRNDWLKRAKKVLWG